MKRGIVGYEPQGWEEDAYARTDKLAKHILKVEKEFEKMTLNPKPFTIREVKNLSRR